MGESRKFPRIETLSEFVSLLISIFLLTFPQDIASDSSLWTCPQDYNHEKSKFSTICYMSSCSLKNGKTVSSVIQFFIFFKTIYESVMSFFFKLHQAHFTGGAMRHNQDEPQMIVTQRPLSALTIPEVSKSSAKRIIILAAHYLPESPPK